MNNMQRRTRVSIDTTKEGMLKGSDLIVVCTVVFILSVFAFVPGAVDSFKYLSKEFSYVMSFMKFAVLATFGECLALRIKVGCYNRKGFGVLPKMIVWGALGVIIKISFVIFATGTPNVLASLGFGVDEHTIKAGTIGMRMFTAFSISVCLNLIFAPVMMTLHKITDLHIHTHKGRLTSLTKPIDFPCILKNIDWTVMHNFVFRKTIPFFWIPAHTITFLLPGEYQILFAAVLGIALGLLLAMADTQKSEVAVPA